WEGAAALPRVRFRGRGGCGSFAAGRADGRRHKPLQGWRGPDGGARALLLHADVASRVGAIDGVDLGRGHVIEVAARAMPKNAIFRHTKEPEPGGPRHEYERIAPGGAGKFRQGQGLDRPLRLVERGRARGASPDGKDRATGGG